MANVEDRQSCHQKAALLQLLHLAGLGAHYHELDIALPTAGSKTGRTIRKPALLTVRPASEREQDSRKRDNERDQLKSQSEQSGGYDRLDDHRLLTWINHCSFFYANLEYLASLGCRT